MNESKEDGVVFKTTDYDSFKKLKGNRGVTESRVEKISRSINKYGWVRNPIVVNENMEVIDGQGRLEALKKLGLPVEYVIAPGAGQEECVAMNLFQKNWGLKDHIESFADMGNESYKMLLSLVEEFGNITIRVIINAINRTVDNSGRAIKEGDFVTTKEAYERARKILAYEQQFVTVFKKIDGRSDFYLRALRFTYLHPEIDNDRMLKKVLELQTTMKPAASMVTAMEQLESVYNSYLQKGKKVYIVDDYKKAMDGRLKWFEDVEKEVA